MSVIRGIECTRIIYALFGICTCGVPSMVYKVIENFMKYLFFNKYSIFYNLVIIINIRKMFANLFCNFNVAKTYDE